MKFALAFSNTGPFSNPDKAVAMAQAAEAAGFESLWTVEHVVVPSNYDSPYPYDASGKKISNAKLSVKHNGVTIHDGLDLPKGTPGKDPEADSRGPLFLQDHGNPVTFRNIWVQRTGK